MVNMFVTGQKEARKRLRGCNVSYSICVKNCNDRVIGFWHPDGYSSGLYYSVRTALAHKKKYGKWPYISHGNKLFYHSSWEKYIKKVN